MVSFNFSGKTLPSVSRWVLYAFMVVIDAITVVTGMVAIVLALTSLISERVRRVENGEV